MSSTSTTPTVNIRVSAEDATALEGAALQAGLVDPRSTRWAHPRGSLAALLRALAHAVRQDPALVQAVIGRREEEADA